MGGTFKKIPSKSLTYLPLGVKLSISTSEVKSALTQQLQGLEPFLLYGLLDAIFAI